MQPLHDPVSLLTLQFLQLGFVGIPYLLQFFDSPFARGVVGFQGFDFC
jgi:hypothetical protein